MRRTVSTLIFDAVACGLILVVLVALVSPVIGAARLSPEAASCMDNERRIGLALRRYTEDYMGYFPTNRPAATKVWKDAIAPFLGISESDDPGKAVFRCPANPAVERLDETIRWPRSYAYNGALGWGKYVSTAYRTEAIRTSDIGNPAAYMLIVETRNWQADLGPWMIDGNAAPDGGWTNERVRYADENVAAGLGCFHHHDKRMNVVMVDGHTVAVTLPQTIATPQMWNPWQPPGAYEGKIDGMLPEYK